MDLIGLPGRGLLALLILALLGLVWLAFLALPWFVLLITALRRRERAAAARRAAIPAMLGSLAMLSILFLISFDQPDWSLRLLGAAVLLAIVCSVWCAARARQDGRPRAFLDLPPAFSIASWLLLAALLAGLLFLNHMRPVWVEDRGVRGLGYGQRRHFTLSPDGKELLTCETPRAEARIYDLSSGKVLGAVGMHDRPVVWAEYSPDGQRVVTASEDHTARVWERQDGKAVYLFDRHCKAALTASFSPDGLRIVSVGPGDPCYVWEAASGKLLFELGTGKDGFRLARFSPRGDVIATGTPSQACLWDARTGQQVRQIQLTPAHRAYVDDPSVVHLAFSPDGTRLLAAWDDIGGDNGWGMWDVESGQELTRIPRPQVCGMPPVDYSPDGSLIVAVAPDGRMALWDARSFELLDELPLDRSLYGHSVRFLPCGRRLLVSDNMRLYVLVRQREAGPRGLLPYAIPAALIGAAFMISALYDAWRFPRAMPGVAVGKAAESATDHPAG